MKKTLYYGGSILTMDKTAPRAEALLTENGKIVAVGRYDDLKEAGGSPFDLAGRTLMPAFVDGHSHFLGYGIDKLKNCDLSGCASLDELLLRIRKFRESRGLTHGEPISCRGYDPEEMRERRHPDAALLDALGFDNPIACTHISGHVAVYNTVAMKAAGVLDGNYVCPAGGFAGRDENGNLTGYFEETAKHVFAKLFTSKDPNKEMRDAALLAQGLYLKNGYATVQDGSENGASHIEAFHSLSASGALKLDVVAYLSPRKQYAELRRALLAEYGSGYRGHLKLGGCKTFLDGSPQARTAWLSKPYEGEREYCGYPTVTDETLAFRIGAALDEGLQIMAHCNGDAASEQFIRVFKAEAERRGLLGRDLRPVMIHAQTVRYDQLQRMKPLTMMPSFFVGHCHYWGDTHLRNLGERGRHISPTGWATELGIPFSLHQDCPVTPPDMLHSIHCAVNRVTRSGAHLDAENRISVYDALIAATRGGAYQYFEENEKGVLRSGAYADLILLDRDPTSVDPTELKDLRVEMTVKEDEIIYEA